MSNEEKRLMKGNEAIAEAAILAGCRAYFGYPITPQNEITAHMARNMIDRGRVFIQAESEVAAINMVYGSAATGARAMTSSSSPGLSLKQEGISYAAGADLPIVVVNVQRAGPGLGAIAPAQGDYFQTTRGGGHGDYYCIVLAPKSVQEAADLTYLAFDLADKWRVPVFILADGMIGQMMEGVVLPKERPLDSLPKKDWAVGGMAETHRAPRHVTSLDLVPENFEIKIRKRYERYEQIKAEEVRFESISCGYDEIGAGKGSCSAEDADLVMVAYGTSARVCLGARKLAEKAGIKLGLFRPITLWPFPYKELARTAKNGKPILVVEMSMGQMVEDVKLSVLGSAPVHFFGRVGGMIPTEEEVFAEAKRILGR
ncbi:MAG: 3-methyl-2-oxobutanoate dehydrogenase subunit VorB [Treponemataceae bacterium]